MSGDNSNKNMCFICLEKCNIKRCNVCTCIAHTKCWNRYINLKMNDGNVSCPICRSNIELPAQKTTRSLTKRKRWKNFSNKIMGMFKEMNEMEEVHQTLILQFSLGELSDKNIIDETLRQKSEIAKKIFKLVIENKILIKKKSLPFFNTIKNRLQELQMYDNWEPASEFLYKLR